MFKDQSIIKTFEIFVSFFIDGSCQYFLARIHSYYMCPTGNLDTEPHIHYDASEYLLISSDLTN